MTGKLISKNISIKNQQEKIKDYYNILHNTLAPNRTEIKRKIKEDSKRSMTRKISNHIKKRKTLKKKLN